jgi:hypothetical protein
MSYQQMNEEERWQEQRLQRMEADVVKGNALQQILKAEAQAVLPVQTSGKPDLE